MLVQHNIILRSVKSTDVDKLLEWENDVENWEVSNTKEMFTREEIAFFVASKHQIATHGQTRFMICFENEKNAIGCIDLFSYDAATKKIGVGILIGEKQYRNKGYAKQALCLLTTYTFSQLDISTIFAEVSKNNTSSVRLFESCGFLFKKNTVVNEKTMKYYELKKS